MSYVGFYEIDPASGNIDCSAVVDCHVGNGGAGFVHDGQGCAFVHMVMQFTVCTIYPDAGGAYIPLRSCRTDRNGTV